MEEESLEEESWRRNHRGGIMEETSLMRNHGGGIWRRLLDEASWMRNQGGDIMEEASWGLVGQGRSGARKC